MCPACFQNIAIALIGLTSSTGLVALVMSGRGPEDDQAMTTRTSNDSENDLPQ